MGPFGLFCLGNFEKWMENKEKCRGKERKMEGKERKMEGIEKMLNLKQFVGSADVPT
jgi:hypothetical protein